ncbi:hypothetical protein [Capybara microvirus Cap3_SP_374]|nr:hypothetical protein [Capybara microvirus Cap3_SP_374]
MTSPKGQDIMTQQGLAMTPSEMAALVEKGIPISPNNTLLQFQEGTTNVDFNLPIDQLRGTDINDAWNAQNEATDKLRGLEFRKQKKGK